MSVAGWRFMKTVLWIYLDILITKKNHCYASVFLVKYFTEIIQMGEISWKYSKRHKSGIRGLWNWKKWHFFRCDIDFSPLEATKDFLWAQTKGTVWWTQIRYVKPPSSMTNEMKKKLEIFSFSNARYGVRRTCQPNCF